MPFVPSLVDVSGQDVGPVLTTRPRELASGILMPTTNEGRTRQRCRTTYPIAQLIACLNLARTILVRSR